MSNEPTQAPPPGWYDDGAGRERWFDGEKWTETYKPVAATTAPQHPPMSAPMSSFGMTVKPEVSYTRQQKGHSLLKHLLLLCLGVGLITIPYYSISPNHYWHA